MSNDPPYNHPFGKEIERMGRRNIEEKNTNRNETSTKGQQDFFRGADERDCDDKAWESEAKTEIEQVAGDRGRSQKEAEKDEKEEDD